MANCGCESNKKPGHVCVECYIDQRARNNYFTGKMLVERDFTDEQRYFMGKDRRHNQYLHGEGVTCGLKVKQHPNPDCRNHYVLVEPGVAIDCCGREIIIDAEQTVDLRGLFDDWLSEQDADPDGVYDLQLVVCYRECEAEEVPALFCDSGCDDTATQPNRILESYRFGLRVEMVADPEEEEPGKEENEDELTPEEKFEICLEEIAQNVLAGCPGCSRDNSCVVLAKMAGYVADAPFVEAVDADTDVLIDNSRDWLFSTRDITRIIECIVERVRSIIKGIEVATVTMVDCEGNEAAADVQALVAAEIITNDEGQRELTLQLPTACGITPGIDTAEVNLVDCGGVQLPQEIQDLAGAQIEVDTAGQRSLMIQVPTECGTEETPGIDDVQVNLVDCDGNPVGPEVQDLVTVSIEVDASGQRVLTVQLPNDCGREPETPGIDDVQIELVDCDGNKVENAVNELVKAKIVVDANGERVLTIQLPNACSQESRPEVDFTRICAINWDHGENIPHEQLTIEQYQQPGLMIAFNKLVRNGDIHRHSVRLLVGSRGGIGNNPELATTCWCEISDEVLTGVNFVNPCNLRSGLKPAFDPEEAVNGLVLVPTARFQRDFDYRVVVEGDYIRQFEGIDLKTRQPKWGSAVDADHLPPWLPDRKTGDGVEGGTFNSWFTVSPFEEIPTPPGRVNVNLAPREELMTVNGIGPELAEAIIARRTTYGPFASIDELTTLTGVGEKKLANLHPMITTEEQSNDK